ncbi:MAG: hypothetical protein WCG26_14425, partial [Chloroflexales bacterium]
MFSARARWLKPRATRCEGRLRGLQQPAQAGFVNQAPGTSVPRLRDLDEIAPMLSLKNLLRRKVRTLLTILGIAVGV